MAFDNNKTKNTNSVHKDQNRVDQSPADDKVHEDELTTEDLKGKKVDADPEKKEDQPIEQNK